MGPAKVMAHIMKESAKTGADIAKIANSPDGRKTLKKLLNTNKELIRSSIGVVKMGIGAGFFLFNSGFLLNIICAKTSFPIGMINSIFPITLCLPEGSEERKKETSYTDSQKTSDVSSAGSMYNVDTTNDKTNTKLYKFQSASIRAVKKILEKYVVEQNVNVSTYQTVKIKCPSDLLDNNPIMKRMVDVRSEAKGDNIWRPALIDNEVCSNGDSLEYTDKNGNEKYDTCDPVDASELISIDPDNPPQSIDDKGGWKVTYQNGEVENNIREWGADGERNIRYVYGCCPVSEQVANIKVQKISGEMKKITNEVKNQIDILSKDLTSVSGCARDNAGTKTSTEMETDIEIDANIEKLIKQQNDATIVAAQNINYEDYYQACFKGKSRTIKQEIDIDVLSVNIIKSAVKTLFDNKISLKSETESTVTFTYESYTPRILILSFFLNMIVLFISYKIIYKLLKKKK